MEEQEARPAMGKHARNVRLWIHRRFGRRGCRYAARAPSARTDLANETGNRGQVAWSNPEDSGLGKGCKTPGSWIGKSSTLDRALGHPPAKSAAYPGESTRIALCPNQRFLRQA